MAVKRDFYMKNYTATCEQDECKMASWGKQDDCCATPCEGKCGEGEYVEKILGLAKETIPQMKWQLISNGAPSEQDLITEMNIGGPVMRFASLEGMGPFHVDLVAGCRDPAPGAGEGIEYLVLDSLQEQVVWMNYSLLVRIPDPEWTDVVWNCTIWSPSFRERWMLTYH